VLLPIRWAVFAAVGPLYNAWTMQPVMRYSGWQRFPDVVTRLVPDAITAAVLLTFTMVAIALALGNPIVKILDGYQQDLWMPAAIHDADDADHRVKRGACGDAFLSQGDCGAGAGSTNCPANGGPGVSFGGRDALSLLGTRVCAWPSDRNFLRGRSGAPPDSRRFSFPARYYYGAQALWQYGLSSSGQLLVASKGHFLQDVIGVIPLATTIWPPAAILHELTYAAAAITAAC
jgi:hypothetical protein